MGVTSYSLKPLATLEGTDGSPLITPSLIPVFLAGMTGSATLPPTDSRACLFSYHLAATLGPGCKDLTCPLLHSASRAGTGQELGGQVLRE